MDKHYIDNSTQARTNPVFMTAKTAVCLMAQADLPCGHLNLQELSGFKSINIYFSGEKHT